jgi:hypothetical protein
MAISGKTGTLFDSRDPGFDQYVDLVSNLSAELSEDLTRVDRYTEAIELLMKYPSAHVVVIAPPDTEIAF